LGLPGKENPGCPPGFFAFEVVFLKRFFGVAMRTYDKLIAAIFARRAKGGLRSFPGDAGATAPDITQETG
jgi:hypothetical protein